MKIPARYPAILVAVAVLTTSLIVLQTGAVGAAPKAVTTGTAAPAAVPPPAAPPAIQEPRGRVYLFRGALGPIFSLGMDKLTDRIKQAGFTASVDEFTICGIVADRAIREYRADPAPIILVGHSMGGLCSVLFAERLQEEKIPVSLIVAVDPAHATHQVPLNVERFINVFLSTSVLGGGDVTPKDGFKGHYASIDLAQHSEVTHINIDKMDTIHEQIVAKVKQVSAIAPNSEGEALPIRLVVPPDAPIELWDSGMPVFARPGYTLDSLATLYHVPRWSLIQLNKGIDGVPLIPGQRVVVPRHLVPPPVTAAAAPPAAPPQPTTRR